MFSKEKISESKSMGLLVEDSISVVNGYWSDLHSFYKDLFSRLSDRPKTDPEFVFRDEIRAKLDLSLYVIFSQFLTLTNSSYFSQDQKERMKYYLNYWIPTLYGGEYSISKFDIINDSFTFYAKNPKRASYDIIQYLLLKDLQENSISHDFINIYEHKNNTLEVPINNLHFTTILKVLAKGERPYWEYIHSEYDIIL